MIGLCECGCGEKTSVARWANRTKNVGKGQRLRFRSGHNRRLLANILKGKCLGCGVEFEVAKRKGTAGKYCSVECYGHNHKGFWQSDDWRAVRESKSLLKKAKKVVLEIRADG